MKLDPIEQENFIAFIEENLEIELAGDEETEWKCICPFCFGGNRRRQSFDINVQEGVARCWRADNCGWKGSAQSLIMDVLGVPFLEAQKVLKLNSHSPKALLRMLDKKPKDPYFEMPEGLFEPGYCIEITDSFDVLTDVRDWIENERNFDFDWFLSKYSLMYPPQVNIHKNKIVIKVFTEEIEAYQLYTFRQPQVGPKTVNPDDKILSKCLFNYNNLDFDREGPLLIVEGIFDAVRMESYGINAVAIFGTYIQPTQLALIDDLDIDEVCLCLDYGVEDKIINHNIQRLRDYTSKDVSQIIFDEPWMDPDEFGLREKLFMRYLNDRKIEESNELVQLLNRGF